MALDLQSQQFWSQEDFTKENTRVFDICNGCRRCYALCPSFNILFQGLDSEDVDGDAEKLSLDVHSRVVELCYQCKLCYNHCPYTPPHRWNIDFPRLMLRGALIRTKGRGVTLRDRVLGNTDLVGSASSPAAPLVNLINRMPPARFALEKALGVHRQRILPSFHRQTFRRWFGKRSQAPTASGGVKGKAALFYTCYVNYNDPAVGIASVEVLERNGIRVACPEQVCCGMPFLDGGDADSAIKKAQFNLRSLAQAVDDGYEIVVPGPTCSYMLKKEYPLLLPGEAAEAVASKTYDISEYLMKLHNQGLLDTAFSKPAGKIAYHLPCHLKAQNIGYKSLDLMQLIPGASVQLIEKCSGHDGTFGLKREYFQLSLEIGRRLFQEIEEAQAQVVATDCPLAALQIQQATGIAPLHPVQVIREAYGH